MDLVGTDVATANSQEDTFDPGWRYEDRIGMRIWRVEWMIGDGIDVPWDAARATFDGIHPTPTGYRLYADILGPVVRARVGR